MNIENVKQIFGSPAIVSGKPKNNFVIQIIVSSIAILGIIAYLKYKEKQRKEQLNQQIKTNYNNL